MIEVVLDTETTGLSVADGHRIVEIGCIELKDLIPTKKILSMQIDKGLKLVKNLKKIIISYEPGWSIGTGIIPKIW